MQDEIQKASYKLARDTRSSADEEQKPKLKYAQAESVEKHAIPQTSFDEFAHTN